MFALCNFCTKKNQEICGRHVFSCFSLFICRFLPFDFRVICKLKMAYLYSSIKIHQYKWKYLILKKIFSFESVLSSDKTDPDKNFFNDKLQQIDSPYFSVENFIAISEQLNKENFSILHLNIRSFNANIDNFREFLGSLNGNFSVIVLSES